MDGEGSSAERARELVDPADPVLARAVYDAWAPTYDADHPPHLHLGPELVADRVARLAPPSTDVLDAACGTGLVGAALARRGFTSVDGLDLSPGMLARARRLRVYHDLGPSDLARRLPGAGDKFGVVTCVGALCSGHLPVTALGEFARVVRGGGHLVVTVGEDERAPARLRHLDHHLDRLAVHDVARVVADEVHPLSREPDTAGRLLVLQVLGGPAAD